MCRFKAQQNEIKYEMKKIEINIGQKFNYLTVVEELPVSSNGRVFLCKCDCGNTKKVLLPHLIRSLIKSCGCHRKCIHTKHGMHNSREYSSWENMIQRCTNPKATQYEDYGGRGITVCKKWLDSFDNFYNDMGPRPEFTTLDRKNNDLGYFKENCKWSNRREQLVNVRCLKQTILHNEIKKTVDQLLNELNIPRDIFNSRVIQGLTFKEAIFSNVDIIAIDIENKKQIISKLSSFLSSTGFEKKDILAHMDSNELNPYKGYIIRYLKGFNGWPDEIAKPVMT